MINKAKRLAARVLLGHDAEAQLSEALYLMEHGRRRLDGFWARLRTILDEHFGPDQVVGSEGLLDRLERRLRERSDKVWTEMIEGRLRAIAAELRGEPEVAPGDELDPSWSPALKEARELRCSLVATERDLKRVALERDEMQRELASTSRRYADFLASQSIEAVDMRRLLGALDGESNRDAAQRVVGELDEAVRISLQWKEACELSTKAAESALKAVDDYKEKHRERLAELERERNDLQRCTVEDGAKIADLRKRIGDLDAASELSKDAGYVESLEQAYRAMRDERDELRAQLASAPKLLPVGDHPERWCKTNGNLIFFDDNPIEEAPHKNWHGPYRVRLEVVGEQKEHGTEDDVVVEEKDEDWSSERTERIRHVLLSAPVIKEDAEPEPSPWPLLVEWRLWPADTMRWCTLREDGTVDECCLDIGDGGVLIDMYGELFTAALRAAAEKDGVLATVEGWLR